LSGVRLSEDYVTGKRWLGDGPYRVWKNRLRGVTFGIWENSCATRLRVIATGLSGVQGLFGNVRWLQFDTTEGAITVALENVPFVPGADGTAARKPAGRRSEPAAGRSGVSQRFRQSAKFGLAAGGRRMANAGRGNAQEPSDSISATFRG
jgi:hypothetical protein